MSVDHKGSALEQQFCLCADLVDVQYRQPEKTGVFGKDRRLDPLPEIREGAGGQVYDQVWFQGSQFFQGIYSIQPAV